MDGGGASEGDVEAVVDGDGGPGGIGVGEGCAVEQGQRSAAKPTTGAEHERALFDEAAAGVSLALSHREGTAAAFGERAGAADRAGSAERVVSGGIYFDGSRRDGSHDTDGWLGEAGVVEGHAVAGGERDCGSVRRPQPVE